MKPLLILIFISLYTNAVAQQRLLKGSVLNSNLEPLPYATIQIKGSPISTLTDDKGNFTLTLEEGRYEIVLSLVGYKTQQFAVVLQGKDETLRLIMDLNINNQETAMVLGERKDKAEQYIRNVIKNKDNNNALVKSYSAQIYIKATDETVGQTNPNSKSQRQRNTKNDTTTKALAEPNMALAEINMILDVELPNKTKETRDGVKKIGNTSGLFYTTTTEGDFSLYNNLIRVRAISEMPFLSPISYSGLVAYRYKTNRIRKEGERTIYTIQFKPSKLGNTLISGEVDIMDSSWVILSAQYSLPKYHLAEYDKFDVQQEYQFVNDSIWLYKKQQFNYTAKQGKTTKTGNTLVSYKQYELNKKFPKKYFSNELASTSEEAYKRDSTYWQAVRTEPLNLAELKLIRYTDSVYLARTSKVYLDSIDSITNRITLKKIVFNGLTFYNRAKERTININGLLGLYQPINYGGPRVGFFTFYNKTYKNKKTLSGILSPSYGINNKDLNGTARFTRMYNPFSRGYYSVSVGRSFDFLFRGDAFYSVFQKRNVYRKTGLTLGHGLEIANGLMLINEFEFAKRSSIANFKTYDWRRIIKDTADLAFIDTFNTARSFPTHNAFYNSITLKYTPFQQYLREPLQKVILGSKWPTFSLTWRKGVPNIFKSSVKYDYLQFDVSQTLKLGTVGVSKYSFKVGAFTNRDSLLLPDRKFMRGRDPYVFFNPESNFQHLERTFEITQRFAEAHYYHEFNGAILNKIPILKELQFREMVGGGLLYVPERNLRYAEAFVGLETKPFQFFKERVKVAVFAVGSVSNQPTQLPIQLKFRISTWNREANTWD